MKDSRGRKLLTNENQMKDGRYRYRYIDKNGQRKSVYSWKLVPSDKIPKGKKNDISLREKEKDINRNLGDGIDTSMLNITVYDMIKKYLETKAGIANSTLQNYSHMVEKNIKPNKLSKMKVCDVKRSDILSFYAYLFKERNFAIGTIQLYQNILFPTFQLAVDDSIIRINPCKGCMRGYKQGDGGSEKIPFTKEEQRNLLYFLKNESAYYGGYYPIIALMLGSGVRIGEALGLTWNNIDFMNKCIVIDHQLVYKKKDGKYQFYAAPPKWCKWGDKRIIPLQKNVLEILKKHKENTYFLSLSSGYEIDGYKNFVFINRVYKVSKPDSYVRAFHAIRDEYNKYEVENALFEKRDPVELPDFTPHILRHTYCTRMAENKIDIKVLQKLMGHKNIQVTMQVYNHVNDNRITSEVEMMPDVLSI